MQNSFWINAERKYLVSGYRAISPVACRKSLTDYFYSHSVFCWLDVVNTQMVQARQTCFRDRSTMRMCFQKSWSWFFGLAFLMLNSGCPSLLKSTAEPPDKRELVRDQLIIHSNFFLPANHRIVEDLAFLRKDISEKLELSFSDEPIHVFLFENESRFRKFIGSKHASFPNRRAFFVKSDTQLFVYAFWGDRVAEDLRHEVTHGYLHSTIQNLPLWMDEGIAEYFEVKRIGEGLNSEHVHLLARAYHKEQWRPDLEKLEQLSQNHEMSQLEYAESWLWVHFLLKREAQSNAIFCKNLKRYQDLETPQGLMPQLQSWIPNVESELLMHLKRLAEQE